MEIIIAYILGIVTLLLIGLSVGMVSVFRKANRLEKELGELNSAIPSIESSIYQSIDKCNRDISDARKLIDSRIDTLKNNIEKKLLKG